MLIQQLSVEPTLHLIDQFWIEKTVHQYWHPARDNQPPVKDIQSPVKDSELSPMGRKKKQPAHKVKPAAKMSKQAKIETS